MLQKNSPYITYPKVELHVHIDCSVTRSALIRLGHQLTHDEFLSTYSAPDKCDDLAEYLGAIAPSITLLQTPEALKIVTEEMVNELIADGVIYAELRFAPHIHQQAGLSLDDVMEAVCSGLEKACSDQRIDVRLLLSTLRSRPFSENRKIIELAHRWRSRGVVGVDIAGNEAGHDLRANYDTFSLAHNIGLNVTAHAGEACGADSIWETLRHLRPDRIGHGVRSVEDSALIADLIERDIHLEVCPSSNVQVGVFENLASHSINMLSDAGVSLSINTDARTVAPISLSLEYERLNKVFGWDNAQFLSKNVEAARHAFLPEVVKKRLIRALNSGWQTNSQLM